MNRRTLLLLAFGGAGAASLPSWAGPRPDVEAGWTPAAFTAHQVDTVAAIAEQIIPRTDTAGAKAADVHVFIDAVIADADAPDRDRFLRGLDAVDARARERHGADFVSIAPAQQIALLESISADEFFKAIKTLTITGYYTSKAGMREELGDDGRTAFADYVGCTHLAHKVSA